MSASLVHLIRHGEVDNPHHVVYADLPGYGLSELGSAQADAAAVQLAHAPVRAVMSSPLLRARQTAAAIGAVHDIAIEYDDRLLEWEGGIRWAGVRWEDLEEVFPGELNAYLETPYDLSLPTESLLECGARVAATARDVAASLDGGDLVIVSHQDPIHAGYLELVGLRPDSYHTDKPNHAGIISLEPTDQQWHRVGYWQPEQGPSFPPLEE
ncbi:MAG: histidine phosphatase family protein [Acidimicrobiia bacterium]|nr:histidine phosphatase family protein [Acidimicrobiia bacterium]